MINPVSRAPHSEPVVNAAPATQQAAPPKAPSTTSTPKDSVQISNAAQAALQEIIETPVQTAKEARTGDHQAQTLLAKETTAQKT